MTPHDRARLGGEARAEKYQRIAREIAEEAERYAARFRTDVDLCIYMITMRWREHWPHIWPTTAGFDPTLGPPNFTSKERNATVTAFRRLLKAAK